MTIRPAMSIAAAMLLATIALHGSAGAADAKLTTVDGAVYRGEITRLTTSAITLKSSAGERGVPTRELVSARMPAAAANPSSHRIVLRSGDIISGEIAGGSDEAMQVNSPSLGEVNLPLKDIAGVQLQQHEEEIPPRKQPDKDELVLANGDILPGMVIAFSKESLTFDCALGKLPVPLTRIRTVSFASIGKAYDEPKELLLVFACSDGSAVTASDAQLAGGKLALQTTLGLRLSLPLAQTTGIRTRNGRLIYLSDLEPIEVREVPLFDERPWGYQRDRSVGGNAITLRGREYRKGIGVHSKCELTYDLAGGFKEFSTLVGIDDEVQRDGRNCALLSGGNVEVRIYLDDELAFSAREVKKGQDPLAVKLDVAGVQRLKLVVDFGDELHVNDHADWADARLLR